MGRKGRYRSLVRKVGDLAALCGLGMTFAMAIVAGIGYRNLQMGDLREKLRSQATMASILIDGQKAAALAELARSNPDDDQKAAIAAGKTTAPSPPSSRRCASPILTTSPTPTSSPR